MKDKYTKLKDYFGFTDIPEVYETASDFEKCVLLLRLGGLSYGQIQTQLGNPSKKQIREVLLKWAPELIDLNLTSYRSKLWN